MAIDEYIGFNFINPYAIENFSLITEFHPSPHYFRWNDKTITYVNSRCLVPIQFTPTFFEVWYNIMPLEGTYDAHLREPWLSDVNGFYQEMHEAFIIEYNGQNIRIRHSLSKTSKVANPKNQTSHLESKYSLEPKLHLRSSQGKTQLEFASLKEPCL